MTRCLNCGQVSRLRHLGIKGFAIIKECIASGIEGVKAVNLVFAAHYLSIMTGQLGI
jgi:hypothetical protein